MLDASQYSATPVYTLLDEASQGRIGIDQRWLRAILDRGPAALEDIIRFGLQPPGEQRLDLTDDLVAMARYFADPRALGYLTEVVRRDPTEIPDDLNFALPAFGAAAVEPLLKLADELEEDQAGEVAFLLAGLGQKGVRDPRILALLLDRLEYDLRDGALCLGLYGDPAAIPAIEKFLVELPNDNQLQFALNELREPSKVEDEPFDIWASYPEVSAPDFSVMDEEARVEILRTGSDAADRAEAAHSFFTDDMSDDTVRALLAAARGDSDPVVRARCWETIASHEDSPIIRKELQQRLDDASVAIEERAGCLVGLALLDSPIHDQAVLLYPQAAIRPKVLEAMWRSLDKRFGKYFVAHLDDPHLETQRIAIRGVGYLQLRGELARLKAMWSEEELREDALYAFALAAPSDPTPSALRTLLKRITADARLSEDETELVMLALDERLRMAGKSPVFRPLGPDDEED
ncbi:MAG: hypothetical protein K2X03_31310 [Bryobacteraceae bacterium]|nr:hypothetical protein [Bryobacteraceae bacterium]